jgi:hypothetical protein
MPIAVLMIALFAWGCNESDPDVPPLPIPETEHIVSSSDYLNHRFFRLDLAPGSAGPVHDQPGRNAATPLAAAARVRVRPDARDHGLAGNGPDSGTG